MSRRPRVAVVAVLLALGLLASAVGPATAQQARASAGVDCIPNLDPPPDMICTETTGGGGGGGDDGIDIPVPADAVWFVYYNPTADCYSTGWERAGSTPGYAGWLVLTRPTFGVVMSLLAWLGSGTFTWEDFDASGDGVWDGGEAANAANALFSAFDVQACAAPPNDTPWVLDFIESLTFTAGSVATAPPGDPVVGWPAYVTLEPDYGPLEDSGGVVVTDADGSTSVRWEVVNPNSGNVITVTADPVYRVYWDLDGDPDLRSESHRGDVTWPAEGRGELTHVYRVKGARRLLGQVRWQVEWTTPAASGTEEFVRETPHHWTVREYQGVVDG